MLISLTVHEKASNASRSFWLATSPLTLTCGVNVFARQSARPTIGISEKCSNALKQSGLQSGRLCHGVGSHAVAGFSMWNQHEQSQVHYFHMILIHIMVLPPKANLNVSRVNSSSFTSACCLWQWGSHPTSLHRATIPCPCWPCWHSHVPHSTGGLSCCVSACEWNLHASPPLADLSVATRMV